MHEIFQSGGGFRKFACVVLRDSLLEGAIECGVLLRADGGQRSGKYQKEDQD